ncbi:MAG: hypothetical protein UU54_C0014G0003 [Candidatus Yanofskybacteria bacterium GW2011_GWA2_41_22]|uniref:Uncharacterized protein n=1 Tax=Candidatus Yanofskybacteria bacterium GW2011_GWA2_41_22 TaxID=1619023 RepID=A0A0G0YKW4_9BACT|nr:MAG: hypothetical protein UU54_C0014G0003 [Candidatus Yanofskybacteria bacterium GW2011_GWA2_41_22]
MLRPPVWNFKRQGGDWNLLFGLPRQGRGVADILKFPTADERGADGYAYIPLTFLGRVSVSNTNLSGRRAWPLFLDCVSSRNQKEGHPEAMREVIGWIGSSFIKFDIVLNNRYFVPHGLRLKRNNRN